MPNIQLPDKFLHLTVSALHEKAAREPENVQAKQAADWFQRCLDEELNRTFTSGRVYYERIGANE